MAANKPTCARYLAAMLALSLALLAVSSFAVEPEKTQSFSKAQATEIANKFFVNEIRIEGGIAEPFLRGDDWIFPLKVGAAGSVARDPIVVNRFTGKASWAGLDREKP